MKPVVPSPDNSKKARIMVKSHLTDSIQVLNFIERSINKNEEHRDLGITAGIASRQITTFLELLKQYEERINLT